MSTSENSKLVCDSTNIDSILDDALQDFNKPIPPKKSNDVPTPNDTSADTNAWTEEFINAATKNFESTMKTILNEENNLSKSETNQSATDNGLDMGAMSAEFAKFAEAAAKAASEASSDNDFTECLANAMQEMAKNKEEAQLAPSAEELSKMFEGLSFGESGGSEDNNLGSLFPLMQTILENILSKDIIYPPLKDIVMQYPEWLANNKSMISEDDFNRYNKQYDIMKQVVKKFEDSDNESEETKAKTSESILLLMQKLQELGQPPSQLMGNLDSSPLNMDNQDTQSPDLSSFLGAVGFPSFPTPGGLSPEGTSNVSATTSKETAQESSGVLSDNEQCAVM